MRINSSNCGSHIINGTNAYGFYQLCDLHNSAKLSESFISRNIVPSIWKYWQASKLEATWIMCTIDKLQSQLIKSPPHFFRLWNYFQTTWPTRTFWRLSSTTGPKTNGHWLIASVSPAASKRRFLHWSSRLLLRARLKLLHPAQRLF